MPEISVLMSVYNGEEHIREAIDSILNQTYGEFELIIVDDGSTDRTLEIIDSYSDSRIKCFPLEQNQGVGAALHFGLSQTKGKYIAKADADDIHLPTRLQKQKDFLDQNPEISLVKAFINYFPHDPATAETIRYKNMKSFRENFKNSVITTKELAEKIYWTCCIPHTTVMARSNEMKSVGYDPTLRIGEDYKLFYELNKLGHKMGTVEEVLVNMRVSLDSITGTVQSNLPFWKLVSQIKSKEIENLFRTGTKVFLWGAGEKGKAIIEQVFSEYRDGVAGFIDSDVNKQQETISGYQIYSPSILAKGDKVIITSQPGLYEIGAYLKSRDFQPLTDFIGFF